MNNDFYTFVVLSTINTDHGPVDGKKRFDELQETFKSIHKKVSDVRIIYIDNSIVPLTQEQVDTINPQVDVFVQMEHNLFTRLANKIHSKGVGEIYMMELALRIMKEKGLIGKRIFKLTGRYRLTDTFDITEYEKEYWQNMYCFKVNEWDVTLDQWKTRERVIYFETRLWSMDASLFDEYYNLIPQMFDFIMLQKHNIEIGHFYNIPHQKVIDPDVMHIEGIAGDTGVYRAE
jgi:hypothetical protein